MENEKKIAERKTAKPKTEHILQVLTTEHFTLQTARAATVADANGRASIFIGAVSSSVVALAFIGQISNVGAPFYLLALILFPALLFLGLATFVRALQIAMEDTVHARGINRIRHYYTEIAPETAEYFVHSIYDDMRGVLQDMATKASWWQPLVTTAGTILVVNSILAGAWLALLIQYLLAPPQIWLTAISGAFLFVVSLLAQNYYQKRHWEDFEIHLTSKFPTPTENSSESLR